MPRTRSTLNLIVLLLATSLPIMSLAWLMTIAPGRAPGDQTVAIKLQVDGGKQRVDLQKQDDGSYLYILNAGSDDALRLSPDELAEFLFRQESSREWIERLFNISSPIGFLWVSIGLLGQVLFTGRMVVQWLATEKKRHSVVPPIFWWMSLVGAMMLLTYFLWRRDIVGVLGQSFGLIVYFRNIYFIHMARTTGIQGQTRLE